MSESPTKRYWHIYLGFKQGNQGHEYEVELFLATKTRPSVASVVKSCIAKDTGGFKTHGIDTKYEMHTIPHIWDEVGVDDFIAMSNHLKKKTA